MIWQPAVVSIIALGILLAGCAKPPAPTYLYRLAGGTDQDAARDNYECVQQSRTSWSGGGRGYLGFYVMAVAANQAEAQAQQLYEMCMQARGWRSTTNEALAKRLHGAQAPPASPPPPAHAPTASGPAPDWCKADNLLWLGDRCVEKK